MCIILPWNPTKWTSAFTTNTSLTNHQNLVQTLQLFARKHIHVYIANDYGECSKSKHVNIYCKISKVKLTLKPFALNDTLQLLFVAMLSLKYNRNFRSRLLWNSTITSIVLANKTYVKWIQYFSLNLNLSPNAMNNIENVYQRPMTNDQQGPHVSFHNTFDIFSSET